MEVGGLMEVLAMEVGGLMEVLAIVALSIIAILMVAGTIVDILHRLEFKAPSKNILGVSPKHSAHRGTYQLLPDDDKTIVGLFNGKVGSEKNDAGMKELDLDPDVMDEVVDYESESKPLTDENISSNLGILSKVLIAFSVYTNGSKVLNTSQSPGSLTAIHGIRFLSMSWVILGHFFVFPAPQTANALTVVDEWFHRRSFDVITNAFLSVDTFFTISGLLVAYLMYQEIMKTGWRINWAIYYFHRFWRLTPPYMLSMLLVLGLQKFMGSGALWASTQPAQKTACENNWWTNILYINNFYSWPADECFIHAWYLANDMQFYVITPLMLIPFYFHLYAGLASCLTFLLAQWIIAGVLTAVNRWPVAFFSLAKPPSLDWLTHYYIAPYCRIGPYVIGILAGCYLAHTNGKTRIPKYVVAIGWTAAIATGLILVYGIHGDITGNSPSSVGVSVLYNAVARSAWGVCICWVIVACRCGYGGPVNVLLSWSPFVLLGRLTYMAYLIHPCVIEVYAGNFESLFFIDETNIAISYMGILFFTYMAAFVLMLGLESPMIGIEKILLDKIKI
ncbi:nose resistant to fluoxetine protein 6-like [Physella acuta]|uniref:nose resistant to fluoxetine protein 6-like n=1 Tax=Physella acuta TaxID=109671 RepID=UPI0027DE0A68|nr:nose resistant to fluoxetine protein 6-like [Physella acuta]